MSNFFSQRQGVAPLVEPKDDSYLPPWVRESLVNRLQALFTAPRQFGDPIDVYKVVRPYIWKVLDREPPNNPMNGPWTMYIPRVFRQCEWWQAYDILEELAMLIINQWSPKDVEALCEAVDAAFVQEGIAWRLTPAGKVERQLPPALTAVVVETEALLSDPRFAGPEAQFKKAIEFANLRPTPDSENCVKDAVGALEAVANIVSGTVGKQLNDLLKAEPLLSRLPPTIRLSLDKLYAYRGSAPGVAHAQTAFGVVDLAEALWVLGTVAASVTLLAKKFPT